MHTAECMISSIYIYISIYMYRYQWWISLDHRYIDMHAYIRMTWMFYWVSSLATLCQAPVDGPSAASNWGLKWDSLNFCFEPFEERGPGSYLRSPCLHPQLSGRCWQRGSPLDLLRSWHCCRRTCWAADRSALVVEAEVAEVHLATGCTIWQQSSLT